MELCWAERAVLGMQVHTHTHTRTRTGPHDLAPSAPPCAASCWLSVMMDVSPCAAQLCLPPPPFCTQDLLCKRLRPAAWQRWWMEGLEEGKEEWSHLSGAPGGELATYGCDGWRLCSAICRGWQAA